MQASLDRLGGLSDALRGAFAEVPVPLNLRDRVIRHVGVAPAPSGSRIPLSSRQSLGAALVIGLALGGVLGSGGMSLLMSGSPRATGEAVLAGHLRSLLAPQPFDIASSDRHVVKPWFNGRTTIAPSAPDLADKGFPLVGGRVDIIDGKPVPSLVYRHDRHVISVTIAPKTSEAPAEEEHRGGSTIERWNVGDLTYWAVSDLNARDLRSFVEMFRGRVAQES
ncbi:anti-sigma factor [Lichenihabitans sp. Uapishka_5]|uniref:anti-sigma factor family protein n=1 Tax=Lichenihabitans sp. Uapishka_5 TaxID=3037302 RepID=UPI0029E7E699|nr:anti-sigma factor [Lichenihabitans sp. Uapishka_5]MDX7952425.1 anti-sigma factor [Lichenihabitans sp. Uapishka_5]